jgi:uncharacterized protein YaaW (UPF0174 family)
MLYPTPLSSPRPVQVCDVRRFDREHGARGPTRRAFVAALRSVQHPIYTAMLGMFLGTAIASSRYHALLGCAILLAACMRKTRLEEQILS